MIRSREMSHPPFAADPLAERRHGYLGPAVVADVDARGRLLVTLPGDDGPRWAEMAAAHPGPVGPGRRVLVTVGDDGTPYVIGVLGARPRRVTGRQGGSATLVEDERGERIEVRGSDDELLFEYDPERRSARLRLPEGNLDIVAPGGDVTLAAGRTVRLHGESVELAATSSVRVFVHDLASQVLSALRLGRRSSRLTSERVRVDAERADLRMDETRLEGERLECDVSKVRTTARDVETVAERVSQRVGTLYQEVTGLLQTRAGRLRMLVAGAWHGRAKRADLRTRDTFKVDGEKIHLG